MRYASGQTDKQTDIHRDTLITILRDSIGVKVIKANKIQQKYIKRDI